MPLDRRTPIPTPGSATRSWWQDGFTDGADPEYEEQILPLAAECLAGATRVVDVGTGEGQVARLATRLGAELVVGVDPTRAQLRVAAERGGRPALPPRAPPSSSRSPTRRFDAAIACLVFEHLPDHVPPIAEIARVLAPGGRFVFFLNHPLLQAPNSGWVIDHILEEQYWRIGPYLPVDVTMEELAPGVRAPVRAPAAVAVRERDGRARPAHRAHGGARAARRLPRQGRRVPRRRRRSRACCSSSPKAP